MVELRTRKREIRGDGGNDDKKQTLDKIARTSQFNIANTSDRRLDQECNTLDRRSSRPNGASCTPGFSYPYVFSASFTSSSTISLIPIYNWTTIVEYKVMSSLSISQCQDCQLTLSTAYSEYHILRVPHTLSTAYTEYSIHRVKQTTSTAYTEYSTDRLQHTLRTA